MSNWLFCLTLFFGSVANGASFHNFKYKDSQAVLIDIQEANYNVVIDFNKNTSTVTSTITFKQSDKGYPIFDLRNSIEDVSIDDEKTNAPEINSPKGDNQFRVIGKELSPGTHIFQTKSNFDEFSEAIDFQNKVIDLATHLSDYSEREFLEIFVPTNFEYDQYKMNFTISIIGASTEHSVYANGKVSKSNNSFNIEFPSHFNTSSPFIRISPTGKFKEKTITVQSDYFRDFEAFIYSNNIEVLEKAAIETQKVIKNLEMKFGEWPHEGYLLEVYAGDSGMEYMGGAVSGIEALKHEIIHNYFGRAVFPADGKSGWIDEAITHWIENDYWQSTTPCDSEKNSCKLMLDSLDDFNRHTDSRDMHGERFMAYFDHKFQDQGGLVPFLAHLYKKYKFKPIDNHIFKNELESYFNTNLDEFYNQYIY